MGGCESACSGCELKGLFVHTCGPILRGCGEREENPQPGTLGLVQRKWENARYGNSEGYEGERNVGEVGVQGVTED